MKSSGIKNRQQRSSDKYNTLFVPMAIVYRSKRDTIETIHTHTSDGKIDRYARHNGSGDTPVIGHFIFSSAIVEWPQWIGLI